ncbi:MFS transporter [Nonomuraea diastatica]|uniref:MFS transporter n=1 Tax=Nonomuraea diastatica TaxID=1848329 RepID=A0A4R4X606_9ACTN|nr:MFS transporter [Nonomuraea diastatica]TDD25752.1 MFS transporter [Nonomuraea diastatica]
MTHHGTSKPPSIKGLFAASFIGTSIEWYDYFIFGTAAALVFPRLFFPDASPEAATLASLSAFAAGFLVRPLGAAVIGHFGDRIGRKSMLVLTLILTGGSTFLIGVLPTYAAIGIGAPLLLVSLRLIQSFGVSGEWGGALLISTENAAPGRRAVYGSFAQFGVPIGVLTSNLAFLAVSGMDDEAFFSYGWRIPFLLSAVLVIVGFVVRLRLSEPPEFAKAKQERTIIKVPFAELLRRHPRNLILGGLAAIAPPAVGYAVTVYMLTYGTQVAGFERNTLLTLILASTSVWIIAIIVSAMLSDRFGAKRLYIIGAITAVVWPVPMFAMVNTGETVPALIAFLVAAVVQGIMAGAQGGLFSEMFDLKVRYSGISIAYAAGGTVAGAVTPAFPALFAAYGSSTPVAVFLTVLGAVSLVAVIGIRWTPATREPEQVAAPAVAPER